MERIIDIFGLPLDQLTRTLRNDYGKGLFHAEALYREVFKKGGKNIGTAPEFKNSLKFWTELEKALVPVSVKWKRHSRRMNWSSSSPGLPMV